MRKKEREAYIQKAYDLENLEMRIMNTIFGKPKKVVCFKPIEKLPEELRKEMYLRSIGIHPPFSSCRCSAILIGVEDNECNVKSKEKENEENEMDNSDWMEWIEYDSRMGLMYKKKRVKITFLSKKVSTWAIKNFDKCSKEKNIVSIIVDWDKSEKIERLLEANKFKKDKDYILDGPKIIP